MTSNLELDQYMQKHKGFNNTASIDTIKKLKNNEFQIINYEKAGQGGSHWVCLINKGNKNYYFDSYGLPPQNEIMKATKGLIMHNTFQIQKTGSDVCGQYCIYVIEQMIKGEEFIDIIYGFGEDRHKNDLFIDNEIKL